MTSTKLYAIALVMVLGCDQNWAQVEGDEADPAPEGEPAYGVPSDVDKHGGLHAVGGRAEPAPDVVLFYDQCGSSGGCWWRWTEYGMRRTFLNSGGTTWVSDRLNYSWCMQALGQNASNFWIAPRTAQMCIHGICVDISNRVTTVNGCRSGSVPHSELPLVIGPGEIKHADVYVKLQQSNVPNPQIWVSLNVGTLFYWD